MLTCRSYFRFWRHQTRVSTLAIIESASVSAILLESSMQFFDISNGLVLSVLCGEAALFAMDFAVNQRGRTLRVQDL